MDEQNRPLPTQDDTNQPSVQPQAEPAAATETYTQEPAAQQPDMQDAPVAQPVAEPTQSPVETTVVDPEPTVIQPQTVSEPSPVQAEPVAAPVIEPSPAPQPQVVPTEQPVAASPTAAKKRILLVEDDEGLASVYIARLEAEDFDIRHVPNGEEALSNAIEYKPDMILLDVMMPKISGFDVLDILRNTPETTNIKIIMLTALSQQKDKERAQTLGVDDYLVKSQVVIADVVERIKYHLGVS